MADTKIQRAIERLAEAKYRLADTGASIAALESTLVQDAGASIAALEYTLVQGRPVRLAMELNSSSRLTAVSARNCSCSASGSPGASCQIARPTKTPEAPFSLANLVSRLNVS